jgi:MoaD family protein
MQVNLYANLRQAARAKQIEANLPSGGTVQTALEAVTLQVPALAEELWERPGILREHIKVFVNGRQIAHLHGLATRIEPQDTLDVFPPVGGG